MKLNDRNAQELLTQAPPQILETDELELPSIEPKAVTVGEQVQFDFGF